MTVALGTGRLTSALVSTTGAAEIQIRATGDANFTPASPTYNTIGTRAANGQVLWDDTTTPGTCLANNLC